jgi:hypothetical protein
MSLCTTSTGPVGEPVLARAARILQSFTPDEPELSVFVERLPARDAVINVTRIAGRLPLHASSAGLVLLAWAPRDVQEQVLTGLLPVHRWWHRHHSAAADDRAGRPARSGLTVALRGQARDEPRFRQRPGGVRRNASSFGPRAGAGSLAYPDSSPVGSPVPTRRPPGSRIAAHRPGGPGVPDRVRRPGGPPPQQHAARLAQHPRPPAPELRTMRQVKAVIELVTINVPGPGEAVVKIQAL